MPSTAGGACMWRTKKCADGRSAFMMWRHASREGWSCRADMDAVREGLWGLGGGWVREVCGRNVLVRVESDGEVVGGDEAVGFDE